MLVPPGQASGRLTCSPTRRGATPLPWFHEAGRRGGELGGGDALLSSSPPLDTSLHCLPKKASLKLCRVPNRVHYTPNPERTQIGPLKCRGNTPKFIKLMHLIHFLTCAGLGRSTPFISRGSRQWDHRCQSHLTLTWLLHYAAQWM